MVDKKYLNRQVVEMQKTRIKVMKDTLDSGDPMFRVDENVAYAEKRYYQNVSALEGSLKSLEEKV